MNDILHSNGYIILKKAIIVTNDDIHNISEQINNSNTYVFNNDWIYNDKKRIQTDLKEDNISFMPELNKIIDNINPLLKASKWVILKSEPGCHKQMAHLDYIPTIDFDGVINGIDKNKIPLLILTSIMDNTFIHIWEKSIEMLNETYSEEPLKSNKLLLNAGDILVFRSDMIHAGSEYTEQNIRLHCYLDSSYVIREENTTFIIKLDSPELSKYIIE